MNVSLSRRRLLSLGVTMPFVGALSKVASADVLPPGTSSYVSVAPSRLADTRASSGPFGFVRLNAYTIRVQVAGRNGVPANATAAVLNVTVTNVTAASYVTVYPAGTSPPLASNVNVEYAGQTIANLVTVRLSVDGAVYVYSSQANDVIVDVSGAYVPQSAPIARGRFVALTAAFRALDTRISGVKVGFESSIRVNLSSVLPAAAIAVVVNLTVTESIGPGYWTAHAAGSPRPNSSNLNTDLGAQTRANQAIVPVGSDGSLFGIEIFASVGGHLIVDVAGYFTGDTASPSTVGLFVPSAPSRVLDTRLVPFYGRLYPDWVVEFDFPGRSVAQAVATNLTTTRTRGAGYFTGYPARNKRPLASNLNASYANQTIANHAILRNSSVGVGVYTQSGGHVIVDVAGYFTGSPVSAPLPAPVNNPPPSQLPYLLQIPKLGIVAAVVEGVGDDVVDNGLVGHWPGTGLAGQGGHTLLFAHRTESTALFRNIHLLGPGDEITLSAFDGRVYHYHYARRDITDTDSQLIYNVGLYAALPNVSLVACTKKNFLPTSLDWRLVVTFSLTSTDPG